jgi:hypothetical protein
MRNDIMLEYDIRDISVQTLKIERTFLDKVFAIKRHAICGSLVNKTRHLYDVYQLMKLESIQIFVESRLELKRLIQITKTTDHFYFEKRGENYPFNPLSKYDLESWIHKLDERVRYQYESLHETLLFSDEKQNLDDVIQVLTTLNSLFKEIEE